MPDITQQRALTVFNAIKAELLLKFPINDWCIRPRQLLWTTHKTKYGMANQNGDIYINKAFVSTSAGQLLESTIRHELAHLYVGIKAGHNWIFKQAELDFRASFKTVPKTEFSEFRQQISFQYQLFAIGSNGMAYFIKNSHRKHAKYTSYKPKLFRYMIIKGVKINRFEYRLIQSD